MSAQPDSPQSEPRLPLAEPQPRPMVRIVGLLWVVVIAIVVAFAYFASSLCITFLLASFLALLFDPIPTFLERFRIPRVFSTGLLIIVGVVGVAVAVHASYGRASQIIEDLPDYADRIHEAFEPINQRIQQVQKSAGSITATTPGPGHKEGTTDGARCRSTGAGLAFLPYSRRWVCLGRRHRRRHRSVPDVLPVGSQVASV